MEKYHDNILIITILKIIYLKYLNILNRTKRLIFKYFFKKSY
jgi:hypothetical protein